MKKRFCFQRLAVFVLALSAMMVFVGCEEISVTDAQYKPPENTAAPYPVTVEGITFRSAPQRIVSLSPSLSEALYDIGAWEKVVAAAVSEGAVQYEMLSGKETAKTAVNPDISLILSFSPDLVVTSSPLAVMDVKSIEDSGAGYLYIPAKTDISGVADEYALLSIICNGSIDSMTIVDNAMQGFVDTMKEIEGSDIDVTFAVIQTNDYFVATGDTFISNLLSVFGTNVFGKDTAYSVTYEMLSEALPDVIFLSADIDIEELPSEISQSSSMIIQLSCDEHIVTPTQMQKILDEAYEQILEMAENYED